MTRVLVVEDDFAVRSMLQKILRLEDFEVTVVEEGSKALEVLGAESFEAVVLDVMLPGEDGLTVLKSIRANSVTAYLPVVMLTASSQDENTWAAWRAGCDYYLTKPVDPTELVDVLRRLLGDSHPATY